jgi:cytochrome c oxidase subunit II
MQQLLLLPFWIIYSVKAMFSNATTFVKGIDKTFALIFGIELFFFVLIIVAMIWFIYRYNKKRNPVATQIEGSTSLEIIWTVIPTALVILMFFYGWAEYEPILKAPKDAFTIHTTARMWNWSFRYENGRMTDTLYVPEGKAVALKLEAVDVIHSLYIPAFRQKLDVVPGKPGEMWFLAEKPGRHEIFCAEYCGLRHSYMGTEIVVMPQDEFTKWYTDTTAVTPTLAVGGKPILPGQALIRQIGCIACHSSDGSKIIGPSFKGIYGEDQTVITKGTERLQKVDEAYIKKSILEPAADVVKGFPNNQMTSYKGQLSDQQINQIIEYIKSLNEKSK